MKILLKITTCSLLGYLNLFSITTPTFAGQIYIYKDKTGNTLLTNRKSTDKSLQKIKATYYPDSNIHTYQNWGNSEAAILPSYSKNKNAYDHLIRQASQTHGISEGLIKAVMHTESGFNINARSPVGAQGLMQLMPATARRFNVSNAFDPQQNILGGAKYLSWLMKRFKGNTELVLAAYNAGEGNVAKYGGIPPFRETQDYVRRVSSRLNNLYSNGLGTVNNNVQGKIIAQSNPIQSSNNIQNNETTTLTAAQPTQNKYAQRPIIVASDGTFTDAPSGSYSTHQATAIARITISN